jgi:hypothetical protein
MSLLITSGGIYEEHGDCSELKRQFHVHKKGLKYIAEAFESYDFVPINKGRFTRKSLLKDIEEYKKSRRKFYKGYPCDVIYYE